MFKNGLLSLFKNKALGFQNSAYVLLSFLTLSCAHTEDLANSQSFIAPREKVWEVLVAIFKPYPLKTIDERGGYIETKELKANRFWKAPHQKNQDLSGYSSILRIHLSYKKPLATVFIDKKVYKQKGFISAKEEIPSDFLEEAVLLYHIAKELSLISRLDRL